MSTRALLTVVLIACIVGGFSLGLSRGQSKGEPIVILAATPLGNGFTYQGRLVDGGIATTAPYDMQFTLFDQSLSGIQIAGPITLSNVQVTGGLFAVPLDFGSSAFNGDNRFLQIGIRPGGSAVSFTLLTTRQQITPTPYAIYAKTAGVAAAVSGGCPRRKYYLTSATPTGANADTACVAGYHFASFAEIMDPSNLEYAQNGTDLPIGTAHTLPDSGMGPPFSSLGFIRVGVTGSNNAVAGNANCISGGAPWNTSSASVNGTAIALKPTWNDSPTNISPWDAVTRPCDNTTAPVAHAWCVQD